MFKHILPQRLFCLFLLLCIGATSLLANKEDQFSNRVNLALRQTGHYLLLDQEDSTSTVPPVQYDGTYGYLLALECVFNYDTLPMLLEQAFADYDIEESYELIVKSCDKGVTLLGYNDAAVLRGNIACVGRDQPMECANIFVQFSKKKAIPVKEENYSAFAWLLIPFISGIAFLFFNKEKFSPIEKNPNGHLTLGAYSFDPKNQILTAGEEKFTLTFRENKLLHLFASQPNEVLPRAEILSEVWEDEGVIVGRSLDVFISRLRKLLKLDPSIQIKNVHGVGYRLELP